MMKKLPEWGSGELKGWVLDPGIGTQEKTLRSRLLAALAAGEVNDLDAEAAVYTEELEGLPVWNWLTMALPVRIATVIARQAGFLIDPKMAAKQVHDQWEEEFREEWEAPCIDGGYEFMRFVGEESRTDCPNIIYERCPYVEGLTWPLLYRRCSKDPKKHNLPFDEKLKKRCDLADCDAWVSECGHAQLVEGMGIVGEDDPFSMTDEDRTAKRKHIPRKLDVAGWQCDSCKAFFMAPDGWRPWDGPPEVYGCRGSLIQRVKTATDKIAADVNAAGGIAPLASDPPLRACVEGGLPHMMGLGPDCPPDRCSTCGKTKAEIEADDPEPEPEIPEGMVACEDCKKLFKTGATIVDMYQVRRCSSCHKVATFDMNNPDKFCQEHPGEGIARFRVGECPECARAAGVSLDPGAASDIRANPDWSPVEPERRADPAPGDGSGERSSGSSEAKAPEVVGDPPPEGTACPSCKGSKLANLECQNGVCSCGRCCQPCQACCPHAKWMVYSDSPSRCLACNIEEDTSPAPTADEIIQEIVDEGGIPPEILCGACGHRGMSHDHRTKKCAQCQLCSGYVPRVDMPDVDSSPGHAPMRPRWEVSCPACPSNMTTARDPSGKPCGDCGFSTPMMRICGEPAPEFDWPRFLVRTGTKIPAPVSGMCRVCAEPIEPGDIVRLMQKNRQSVAHEHCIETELAYAIVMLEEGELLDAELNAEAAERGEAKLEPCCICGKDITVGETCYGHNVLKPGSPFAHYACVEGEGAEPPISMGDSRDSCEWNPVKERTTSVGDPFHAYAAVIAGTGRKSIRLCWPCRRSKPHTRLRKEVPIAATPAGRQASAPAKA